MAGRRLTAAQRLAAFAIDLGVDAIPPEVLEAAKLGLLDTLGCGLAAHALGAATEARTLVGEDAGRPEATVIGAAARLPRGAAAFANAMLCHGLDFDSTHGDAVCHVDVVIDPTALAVGEAVGASGAEVLAAMVAGAEVVARLGAAASGQFHARGFHATGVCGVIGAAATAARLEGLDVAQATSAIGLAASLSSGLLAYLEDGSPTKPLHPGWAAHGGVTAARLAARGARGPASALEGRFGLFHAFLGVADVELDGALADLGQRWETLRMAYKLYPACHMMHGALGALTQAVAGHALDPGDVSDVVVTVPERAVPIVVEPVAAKQAPRTPYEGKFSLQFSVAAQLVSGRIGVATYTPAALTDPELLALARRVRCEVRAYPEAAGAFPGGVRVRLADGRVLEADLPYQPGAPENPAPRDEVRAKFRDNAGLALPDDQVAALEAAVLDLDQRDDVPAALAPLAGAGAPVADLLSG